MCTFTAQKCCVSFVLGLKTLYYLSQSTIEYLVSTYRVKLKSVAIWSIKPNWSRRRLSCSTDRDRISLQPITCHFKRRRSSLIWHTVLILRRGHLSGTEQSCVAVQVRRLGWDAILLHVLPLETVALFVG